MWFTVLETLLFGSFKLNAISLESVGLSSIVSTALVFCGADFITNVSMFFTFARLPRKKSLVGFHSVILVFSLVLLGVSVFGDYLKTRTLNLVCSFVIKICLDLGMIMYILFKGEFRLLRPGM